MINNEIVKAALLGLYIRQISRDIVTWNGQDIPENEVQELYDKFMRGEYIVIETPSYKNILKNTL